MRTWPWTLAVLLVCALGAAPASAQAQLDCSALPESVCLNEEILALDGERLTLLEQILAADPQSAVATGEQGWLDGLAACGEDADCYRTAFLSHNEVLRQSLAAAPNAETPLEEPPDAASIEPPSQVEDSAPARDEPRARNGPIYAPSGLPGWGFFTAIGVTLLILFWLLRARARNSDALREDEAQLRDEWR